MAAIWALMFLWEWVGHRWVAKSIKVSCDIGKGGMLINWQNKEYVVYLELYLFLVVVANEFLMRYDAFFLRVLR